MDVVIHSLLSGNPGNPTAKPVSDTNPLYVQGTLSTQGYVWDVNALAWVKATSSSGGGNNVNVTNASIPVTQSGAWTNTVTQSSGANLHANIDNFPASQPTTVSGDVAVVNSTTAGKTKIATTPDNPPNLDVALSTRLKPADTLAGITTIGSITSPLPAGANLMGKVGIDQTTPGTTNGVQVNAPLPSGTNVIGHVVADSGSTTAVTGNVAVVQGTGTNLHAVVDSGNIAVTGSVTANAGTNLNTSALALETGGNLASINTKIPAQGQAAMAASLPVVIANNQSNLPVTDSTLGSQSTVSTTTTALAGGQWFNLNQATGDDTLGYASVLVSVYADNPSAPNGLQVWWSNDNAYFDGPDFYSVPGLKFFTVAFRPKARYCVVKYKNGAVSQGLFQLSTFFKKNPVVDQTNPLPVADTTLSPCVANQGNHSKLMVSDNDVQGLLLLILMELQSLKNSR